MTDYVTLASITLGAFFAVLAIFLLVRYRGASQSINESADIGKDLYRSLETRLKKQDERIVDVMTRLDVIQARVLEPRNAPPRIYAPPAGEQAQAPVTAPAMQQRQAAPMERARAPAFATKERKLDNTEVAVLRLLSQGPRTSVEIGNALPGRDGKGISREHSARILKEFYEQGFVVRDDSNKPYVYRLTEEGNARITTG